MYDIIENGENSFNNKKSVKNCEDGGVFASEPIDIVTVNKDGGEVNGGLNEENCIASSRN